jgi:hypothetical protein
LFHRCPFRFAIAFSRLALTPIIAIRSRSAGLNILARTEPALLAISDRLLGVNAFALALPPNLPSTAAASFLFIALPLYLLSDMNVNLEDVPS